MCMCLRMCSCMDGSEIICGSAYMSVQLCFCGHGWLCVSVFAFMDFETKYVNTCAHLCASVFRGCVYFGLDLLAVSLYLHMWMPVYGFVYRKVWWYLWVCKFMCASVWVCASVSLCMHWSGVIHPWDYICICVWVCVCIGVSMWKCEFVGLCMHGLEISICEFVNPYMHLCVSVHVCICTSVCLCEFVYAWIWSYLSDWAHLVWDPS